LTPVHCNKPVRMCRIPPVDGILSLNGMPPLAVSFLAQCVSVCLAVYNSHATFVYLRLGLTLHRTHPAHAHAPDQGDAHLLQHYIYEVIGAIHHPSCVDQYRSAPLHARRRSVDGWSASRLGAVSRPTRHGGKRALRGQQKLPPHLHLPWLRACNCCPVHIKGLLYDRLVDGKWRTVNPAGRPRWPALPGTTSRCVR
jgi:hypothetical protein